MAMIETFLADLAKDPLIFVKHEQNAEAKPNTGPVAHRMTAAAQLQANQQLQVSQQSRMRITNMGGSFFPLL